MANRFVSPSQQFADSTGAPLNGGTLNFFATSSATPQVVYSDSTLSTSLGSVVTLDSAGRAGNVFLSNLAYKVTLKDSTGAQVWTADPVWSSDYSTLAQVNAWAGNPNGNVAGTAGTQGGLPSSMIWDVTNNVLYICTTTGTSVTAAWTAVNTTAVPSAPNPQGRLTLTTATPVMTTTASAQTTVYYTPYVGRLVPIYNGTNFTATDIGGELSQATTDTTKSPAAVGASALYDMFVWSDSGTIRCTRGPTWATGGGSTTARGTGAGSTELQQVNGIWVNKNAITNGPAAQRGTYVGTIASNAGSTIDYIFGASAAGGTASVLNVWNMYNRVTVATTPQDSTATWNYNTASWRSADNSTGNRVTYICGFAEDAVIAGHYGWLSAAGTNKGSIGIGVDATTTLASGATSFPCQNQGQVLVSTYRGIPGLGQHFIQAIEYGSITTAVTFAGSGTVTGNAPIVQALQVELRM